MEWKWKVKVKLKAQAQALYRFQMTWRSASQARHANAARLGLFGRSRENRVWRKISAVNPAIESTKLISQTTFTVTPAPT
jgi:hypothetical protein